jgi:hypothetical protein
MPYCHACSREVPYPIKDKGKFYCHACYQANVPVKYSDIKSRKRLKKVS